MLALLVYLPGTRAGWIWDDDYYVTRNFHLRSLGGLRELWFRLGAVPQYYPVTHTTFWLEYRLWRLNPLGYHIDNVLLHAASAVMLWIVLRKLATPGAWVIAAVWAVHPVNVESVAWVTERKNVLSAVFYLAALLAYLKSGIGYRVSGMEESSSDPIPDTRYPSFYFLSLVLFGCALLSKSVTASLPAAILLVIWWKRGRIRWRDMMPLLPMFAMALAMGVLTSYMERTYVGARGAEFDFSFAKRVLIAGRAVWFYACKLVWPARLSFIYTRWNVDPRQPWQWVFPILTVAVVIALWMLRNRLSRGPLVAVLFFIGTLVPALGFVNVLPMRYSYVADHFQYLASIGLIAVIVAAMCKSLPSGAFRAVTSALIVMLAVLSWQRQSAFANLQSLWQDTIAKNPTGWMPRLNYAKVLLGQRRFNDAEVELERARASHGENDEIANFLGTVYRQQGKTDLAMQQFRRAVELEPRSAPAQTNLAEMLMDRGQASEAFERLNLALDVKPDDAVAYFDLGLLYTAVKDWPQAAHYFRAATTYDPDFVNAYNNLGAALEKVGDASGAMEAYARAIQLRPDNEQARRNLERLRASRNLSAP